MNSFSSRSLPSPTVYLGDEEGERADEGGAREREDHAREGGPQRGVTEQPAACRVEEGGLVEQ